MQDYLVDLYAGPLGTTIVEFLKRYPAFKWLTPETKGRLSLTLTALILVMTMLRAWINGTFADGMFQPEEIGATLIHFCVSWGMALVTYIGGIKQIGEFWAKVQALQAAQSPSYQHVGTVNPSNPPQGESDASSKPGPPSSP